MARARRTAYHPRRLVQFAPGAAVPPIPANSREWTNCHRRLFRSTRTSRANPVVRTTHIAEYAAGHLGALNAAASVRCSVLRSAWPIPCHRLLFVFFIVGRALGHQ